MVTTINMVRSNVRGPSAAQWAETLRERKESGANYLRRPERSQSSHPLRGRHVESRGSLPPTSYTATRVYHDDIVCSINIRNTHFAQNEST